MAKESTVSDYRKQLKATPIKTLKKTIDKDDALFGSRSNEYLQLEDGKTLKIRIFPAHPGEENFYVAKKSYWLTFENNEGEMKRGTVLDSRVHGGTAMDVVDEYVKYARNKWSGDSERLDAISGDNRGNGLRPSLTWVAYADVVKEDEELRAKIWEMKKTVRDAINTLSCSEDEDGVIEVDPFTDPDTGLPVSVKYLKKPDTRKGENYYDVKFARNVKARPLTDSEIEYFMTLPPLTEVVGTYGIKMFERALEGLQNFDEENDMGLFEDDGWLEKMEEIKAQYDPEESEEKTERKKTVKKSVPEKEERTETRRSSRPESSEEDDDEDDDEPTPSKKEEDEFDDMDRSELKRYIVDNDLEIRVKKSMSDDDLRNEIRAAVAASGDSSNDEDDDEDDDEPEEEMKSKKSLADLKKQLLGK